MEEKEKKKKEEVIKTKREESWSQNLSFEKIFNNTFGPLF